MVSYPEFSSKSTMTYGPVNSTGDLTPGEPGLLGIIAAGTRGQALFKKAGEELQAVLIPATTLYTELGNSGFLKR